MNIIHRGMIRADQGIVSQVNEVIPGSSVLFGEAFTKSCYSSGNYPLIRTSY